ncbi:MAG: class I SAM-dependent methyltransferase [Anaerolineae bacterium]|nr:class I SAM-dependent methyltransferase [Anaerolineae bacterium]
MTPTEHGGANPLENLAYFVGWGGRAWERLVSLAVHEITGTDLGGQTVLEIGARFGRMTCLFALLGAYTVGVDVDLDSLHTARAEARRWDVTDRTAFVTTDGRLNSLARGAFDLVFTKSVLVEAGHLDHLLPAIAARLKPGGKIVFVENARGPLWYHALRVFRYRSLAYTHMTYFTGREIALVQRHFTITHIARTTLPPVVLIGGTSRLNP